MKYSCFRKHEHTRVFPVCRHRQAYGLLKSNYTHMKKIFLYLLVFCAVLSLTACRKCMIYYVCCNVGHPYWKSGDSNISCHGEMAETIRKNAIRAARLHDDDFHGGVETAKVCSVYDKP